MVLRRELRREGHCDRHLRRRGRRALRQVGEQPLRGHRGHSHRVRRDHHQHRERSLRNDHICGRGQHPPHRPDTGFRGRDRSREPRVRLLVRLVVRVRFRRRAHRRAHHRRRTYPCYREVHEGEEALRRHHRSRSEGLRNGFRRCRQERPLRNPDRGPRRRIRQDRNRRRDRHAQRRRDRAVHLFLRGMGCAQGSRYGDRRDRHVRQGVQRVRRDRRDDRGRRHQHRRRARPLRNPDHGVRGRLHPQHRRRHLLRGIRLSRRPRVLVLLQRMEVRRSGHTRGARGHI